MRTTVDKVMEILDDTELDEDIIESYINSANVFITASLGTKGLGDSLLAEIERWLAAHMIVTTRERQAIQEQAGTAMIKWAGKWGEGLLGTTYGQTVIALDTTGTLLAIAKGKSYAWIKAIPNFE
jgi:RNA-binding protein YhbY